METIHYNILIFSPFPYTRYCILSCFRVYKKEQLKLLLSDCR